MPKSWQVTETSPDLHDWKKLKKTGYLTKEGGGTSLFGRKNWKKRFFLLKDGLLSYSETPTSEELGVIELKGAKIEDVSTRQELEFTITTQVPEQRTYAMMADSEDDHIAWFNIIQRVINSMKTKKMPPMLLEVDMDGIRLIDPDTDEVVAHYKLSKLRNWSVAQKNHLCFCANVKKQPYNFMFKTEHASDVVKELNKVAKAVAKMSTMETAEGEQYVYKQPKIYSEPTAEMKSYKTLTKAQMEQLGARDALYQMQQQQQQEWEQQNSQPLQDPELAKQARSLYDYEPTDDSRLPMRRGDIVRVTRIVSDDWWRCNLNGQKGLVPRLYLRPCLQEIMGRALETFNDGKQNHLSLQQGEAVVLLTRLGDSEWWDGLNQRGEVGIFPVNFVEITHGKQEFRDIMTGRSR